MSSELRSDLDHSKQLAGRHTGLRAEGVRPVRYDFSHQAIERQSLMLHQKVAEKILKSSRYFTFAHTTFSQLPERSAVYEEWKHLHEKKRS